MSFFGLATLAATLLIAGLLLRHLGRRGVRRPSLAGTPRCRRCAYDLRGQATRCPECGTDLTATPPVTDGRLPVPRLRQAGNATLLLATLAAGAAAYAFVTTDSTAQRALLARLPTRLLLATADGDGVWPANARGTLYLRLADATPAEREAVVRAVVEVEVLPPDRVVAGAQAELVVGWRVRVPGWTRRVATAAAPAGAVDRFYLGCEPARITVAGRDANPERAWSTNSTSALLVGGGLHVPLRVPPELSVGTPRIELRWRMWLIDREPGRDDPAGVVTDDLLSELRRLYGGGPGDGRYRITSAWPMISTAETLLWPADEPLVRRVAPAEDRAAMAAAMPGRVLLQVRPRTSDPSDPLIGLHLKTGTTPHPLLGGLGVLEVDQPFE